MRRGKFKFRQADSCFVWIEDYARAQALMNQQVQTHWAELLGGLARQLNPLHESIFAKYPLRSEEHTSELQSLRHLVCRLLLEKNKKPSTRTAVRGTLTVYAVARTRLPTRPSADPEAPTNRLTAGLSRQKGGHLFFFNDTATTEIYTLSLHDALPI